MNNNVVKKSRLRCRMTFDQIIQEIGEYGPYQRLIYCLLCLTQVTCALQDYAWVFLSALPDHRCELKFEQFINGSGHFKLPEHILNKTIPLDSFGNRDGCHRFSVELTQTKNITSDWEAIFKEDVAITRNVESCDSWVFDKSLEESTVVTAFSLVCQRQWQRRLGNSGFTVGELIGSILTARFADRYGRRRVFLVGLAGHLAFGFLASYAPNFFILFLFRIVLGASTITVFIVGFIMILELVGPSKRTVTCIATGYFNAMGYLLTSLFAYLLRRWWVLQIVISVPALAFLCYFWLIPESARWLLTHNRYREAKWVLEKEAKFNNKTLPQNVVDVLDQDNLLVRKKFGCSRYLIRNLSLAKKTAVLCFAWFFNCLAHYGFLSMYTVKNNDYVWYGVQAGSHFVAITICILILDRLGRRRPLCFTTIISGIILLVYAFVQSRINIAVIISLVMVGKVFINVATNTILLYTGELYPTVARGTSLGLAMCFFKIGEIVGPAFGLLGSYWRPLPSVIFGVGTILSGAAILLLPVTNKQTLPDLEEENELEDLCGSVETHRNDAGVIPEKTFASNETLVA